MRNLKRVLSLALALMMALSLMAFTGSASAAESATIPVASDLYPDYDQTNYPEAVDVITALKIVEGSDGQLLPNGTLTRAEATTIAARMLLGVNAAATLPNVGTVTGYTDVDSVDHWAAPYIAFCDNQGIVSGVGGGNFDPNGQLTGVAFGKVILTVLGYDADKEGLKGDSWATNVLVALANAGIKVEDSEGNPIDLTKPITREQAMEMTFQALQTPLVEYPALTINQGAIATKNGASFVTNNLAKTQTISNRKLTGNNYYTLEFAEKYFQTLVLKGTTDPFGRPTHTWILNNVTIDEYDDNDLLVAEYDSLTTDVKISGDLGNYYLWDDNDNANNKIVVAVNDYHKYTSSNTFGTENEILFQNTKTGNPLTAGRTAEEETIAQRIADLTGNGTKVEIYADDENIVTNIVVIDYAVGILSIARPVTNDRTNYAVTNAKWKNQTNNNKTLTGSEFDNADVEDTVVYYEGAAAGDIVTCAQVDQVLYIYPTEAITGSQTNKHTVVNTNEKTVEITVSGSGAGTYILSTGVDGVLTSDFMNSKNAATYYMDQYGFVVYTDKSTLSYAYIVAASGTATIGLDGVEPSVQVRAVLEDGTVGVYNVNLTYKSGDWYLTNTTTAANKIDTTGAPETIASDVNDDVKDKLLGGHTDPISQAGYTVWDYAIDGNTITLYSLGNRITNTNGLAQGAAYYGAATSKISKGSTSASLSGGSLLMDSQTVYVVYNEATHTAARYVGNTNMSVSGGISNAQMVVVAADGNNATAEISRLVFATINVEETNRSLSYAYIYVNDGIDSSVAGINTYEAYTANGGKINLTDNAGMSGTAGVVKVSGIYSYDTSTNEVVAKLADYTHTTQDENNGKVSAVYQNLRKVTTLGSNLIEAESYGVTSGAHNDTGKGDAERINTNNNTVRVLVNDVRADENNTWAFVVYDDSNIAKTIFILPEDQIDSTIGELDTADPFDNRNTVYTVKAPAAFAGRNGEGSYSVTLKNGNWDEGSEVKVVSGGTVTVTVTCTKAPTSGTDTVSLTGAAGLTSFTVADKDDYEDQTFTASGDVNLEWDVVHNAPAAPSITGDLSTTPIDKSKGGSGTLSVTASATDGGTLSYQWQKSNDQTNWDDIDSETSATYNYVTTTVGTTYYRCIVTETGDGGEGTTTSKVATVTILPLISTVGYSSNTLTIVLSDALPIVLGEGEKVYVDVAGTAKELTKDNTDTTGKTYTFDDSSSSSFGGLSTEKVTVFVGTTDDVNDSDSREIANVTLAGGAYT